MAGKKGIKRVGNADADGLSCTELGEQRWGLGMGDSNGIGVLEEMGGPVEVRSQWSWDPGREGDPDGCWGSLEELGVPGGAGGPRDAPGCGTSPPQPLPAPPSIVSQPAFFPMTSSSLGSRRAGDFMAGK